MPKIKKQKSERVTGDNLIYFFLHNIVSVFFFFLITMTYGLYNIERNDSISYLITGDFWILVLQIFLIGVISGILGRLLVFIAMRVYYHSIIKVKVMKNWTSINKGWNKISLAFFLSSFITAILFVIGFTTILQNQLFTENTLLTLIASYALLKVGVFVIVRTITEIKL